MRGERKTWLIAVAAGGALAICAAAALMPGSLKDQPGYRRCGGCWDGSGWFRK